MICSFYDPSKFTTQMFDNICILYLFHRKEKKSIYKIVSHVYEDSELHFTQLVHLLHILIFYILIMKYINSEGCENTSI